MAVNMLAVFLGGNVPTVWVITHKTHPYACITIQVVHSPSCASSSCPGPGICDEGFGDVEKEIWGLRCVLR